ncbi:hypothetical protein [Streptomyces xylophagus]|uniref:hypothetical protein n=1 Tax=Streptomyces xylophagus TaxID=285514 RepID=UPI0005B77E41|nr:hypothetical protein [Streptomyces xylophagus]
MRTWRLMHGDIRPGELREYEIDQPMFLCHFVPGPGWESVRALFEAWADVQGSDPDGSRHAEAIRPLMDLGLTLHPSDGGTPLACFRDAILRIYGDTARLRY